MTFAIFYSVAGRAGMTSGGYPSVEPGHNVLTHIIWSVPEGTTSKMVSEKWGPTQRASEFCPVDECPDDVKSQIEAEQRGTNPNPVGHADWYTKWPN